MKRFLVRCFAVGLIASLFSGCFDTTEELTIAENGSGTYKVAMDFSGLFDMFEAMKAMDTSGNADLGFPKERKDSTVHLRDYADTATALTAEQKALFKNATVNVVMDEKEKEFKMGINMPFEKISDVEKLIRLMGSEQGSGMLSGVLKRSSMDSSAANDGTNMPDLNTFYDMTVTKNNIERKLNKVKYDSVMQQYGGQLPAEGMGDMFSNITLNTVIHLPRAVKTITSAKSVLSDDKKTITIKATLEDLLKNPQAYTYRIEY